MNRKILIGGAIGLVVVVIAIVLAILFLGKGKDTPDNDQTNFVDLSNLTLDEMAEEMAKDSDMNEQEILNMLTTPLTDEDLEKIETFENLYDMPEDVELMEDDNPNDAKYSMIDKDGNIYDVIDPFLLMTDEEVEEYLRKMDELNAALLAEAEEEEIQRLELEAEDLIPDIPLEDLVDQNIIDQGFEADIDSETGDIGYWNTNTEKDPLSEGLTEIGSEYDESHHGSDPGYSSIFTVPDDPWENQPGIDYGGAGG